MRHHAALTREDVAELAHMNPATLWRLETAIYSSICARRRSIRRPPSG
ncbi:helix-turn-helix domain-containing protein [Plantactinospora sp. BB1]|nr:hypothetical protein C6W10_06130 [Plantactinospora sp. BB1]